jgi:hypothetical protein
MNLRQKILVSSSHIYEIVVIYYYMLVEEN